MKLIAIYALMVITPGLALSQTYSTYQSRSCGEFMREPKNQISVAMASEYLRGFLSAHNLFSGRKQATQDLSNNTLGLWVEKYCTANPLNGIQDAAPVLLAELTGPLKFGK